MEDKIDISGIEKHILLAALFNGSKQQGLGFLDTGGAALMTDDDAKKVIDNEGMSFDYLRGRVMKVRIDGDELEPWLYDRDNGEGAAAGIVAALRN